MKITKSFLYVIFFCGLSGSVFGIRDNINQVPLNILNFILLIIALILFVQCERMLRSK